MFSDRSALPSVLVASAMLVAATTGLMVSYAGAPSGVGVPVADVAPAMLLGPERGAPMGGKAEEEEEKREELEDENEKAQYAERAENAREKTEEDAEAQKSSTTPEDRAASALLRAQGEVIAARDAESGMPSDPCSQPLQLPPGGARVAAHVTRRAQGGGEETPSVLHEVASRTACTSEGGFFLERQTAPSRVVLCPVSCEWAKAAPQGVRVDVMMTGL
jgi:hypothetical protein